MMSSTVMRGFERGIRVLEDHLHAPAHGLDVFVGDDLAVE
jgi:hypothetical protein